MKKILDHLYQFLYTYAFLKGYWWAKCSLCGRHFWGPDKKAGTLFYLPGRGKAVCPRCVVDGTLARKQSELGNIPQRMK